MTVLRRFCSKTGVPYIASVTCKQTKTPFTSSPYHRSSLFSVRPPVFTTRIHLMKRPFTLTRKIQRAQSAEISIPFFRHRQRQRKPASSTVPATNRLEAHFADQTGELALGTGSPGQRAANRDGRQRRGIFAAWSGNPIRQDGKNQNQTPEGKSSSSAHGVNQTGQPEGLCAPSSRETGRGEAICGPPSVFLKPGIGFAASLIFKPLSVCELPGRPAPWPHWPVDARRKAQCEELIFRLILNSQPSRLFARWISKSFPKRKSSFFRGRRKPDDPPLFCVAPVMQTPPV